jgi:hypothetical protein
LPFTGVEVSIGGAMNRLLLFIKKIVVLEVLSDTMAAARFIYTISEA